MKLGAAAEASANTSITEASNTAIRLRPSTSASRPSTQAPTKAPNSVIELISPVWVALRCHCLASSVDATPMMKRS